VVLAAALVCLGNLCRSEAALPARLGLLAYVAAALLVGIALAGIMQPGTPYDVSASSPAQLSDRSSPSGSVTTSEPLAPNALRRRRLR